MKDKYAIAAAMNEIGLDKLDKMSITEIFEAAYIKGYVAAVKADIEANKQILETKHATN